MNFTIYYFIYKHYVHADVCNLLSCKICLRDFEKQPVLISARTGVNFDTVLIQEIPSNELHNLIL